MAEPPDTYELRNTDMQVLLVRHALPLRSEHGQGSDPNLSDEGSAQIARFGTQDQKDHYLTGLLSGEIFSCFSMTEPQGCLLYTSRCV